MWKWIFDYNYGVLNTVLLNLGWIKEKINWLGDAAYYRGTMMVVLVWSGTGFDIILFSAALTAVNRSCYEAAAIDGAGPIRRFFHITFPAISPTTFYLLIMGLIGSLQEFTRFQVMSPDGGPEYKGLTLGFYLYRTLFNASGGSDLGKATAIGWLIALLIGIVTALNFVLSKKWVSYD
jgi:multiple sugar transport system permease protein